jgi:hypothetical protein
MTQVSLNGRVFKKRKGLDGPYQYPNSRVLYFDPVEKLYYDPTTTDYYVSDEEMAFLKGLFLEQLSKEYNEYR